MNLLLDTHVLLWCLLISQAAAERLTLVTADPQMEPYGVPLLRTEWREGAANHGCVT